MKTKFVSYREMFPELSDSDRLHMIATHVRNMVANWSLYQVSEWELVPMD